MKITDILSSADVLIERRTFQKRQLLEEVARKMAPEINIPVDQITLELLKREELGSTGTGAGVAIPHARIGGLAKPFGFFVKLTQPIDFHAIDGQPVDLVFVVLLPAVGKGEQLGALASVARKLRAPQAVARMRNAKTPAELYSAITE